MDYFRQAALVKVCVLVIYYFSIETIWVKHIVADIWTWRRFWRQAQAGGIPYVDYTKEYPVGAGLIYWTMSPFLEKLTEIDKRPIEPIWDLF